jgi:hypothetical protein
MPLTVASAPHLRKLGFVITIASLAAIAYATLLPEPGESLPSHFCLICGSLGSVDAILNVLLFVPLGIGLALYGIPARRALLTMFALSVIIETAQLLFISGRDATIRDVVTNTFGGWLGFAASRHTHMWLQPSPRIASTFIIAWSAIWLAIQTISSFAFAPLLPESQYYGQLARSLGHFAVFHGHVLAASVDDIAIPNTAFADSHGVQLRLLHGATVATTVVPAERTRDIAPIVRVADSERREIILLAQNDADLLFTIRSGAAALRLRPPVFSLPNTFPNGVSASPSAIDTLSLSGRYLAREVVMNARAGSATHGSRVPLTASLGWTLALPSQWYIEGTRTETLLSWVWITGLMIPFGYWAVHTTPRPQSSRVAFLRATAWLAALAVFGAGFALAPRAFGLSAAPLREWLAALVGVFFGAGLAVRTAKLTEPSEWAHQIDEP